MAAAVSLLSLLASAAAGDWAVITGASTGIGRQLALEAAREGYNVVLTARRAPLLQKLAAEIEAEHAVATRVCAGCLTDAKFVERLRDAAPGSVSLLVANAGCGMEGDAVAAPRARVRSMLELNVLSTTQVCQLFASDFVRDRRGRVLLVSSLTSAVPMPGGAAYAASKSYVRSFAGALRDEVRPAGVSVTCVCPGATTSDFAAASGIDTSPAFSRAAALVGIRMDGDDVARRAMRATLRGRGELVPGVLNKAHAALSPVLGALGREIAAFFFCPETPWHARRRRRSPEWSQAQGG